jgi:hypothetical protein
MEAPWSTGTIKKMDKDKRLGIIVDTDGSEVLFALDDLILPESVSDAAELANVQDTVIFQKVPSKFGSEAKKIAILDQKMKK